MQQPPTHMRVASGENYFTLLMLQQMERLTNSTCVILELLSAIHYSLSGDFAKERGEANEKSSCWRERKNKEPICVALCTDQSNE